MRQNIWSQLFCLFALYIVILLAQEQDHAHNNQESLDENDYQMCGVENNETEIFQTDRLIEVIKGSNITYSVLTYSEEYLDREIQRLALRHAFDIITEIINVDFIEVANTSDVVIQFQYGVDLNTLGYSNHHRDVIAHCEKERNQSAPGTNSLVQILFDINIKWAYLDAEKILMETTKQKWSAAHRTNITYSKFIYVDFLYAALHEIGHVLGLDHTYDKNSLMRQRYRPILDTHGNYIVPRISDHDIIQLRDNFATNNFSCIQTGICRDLHAEKREEEEELEPKFTENYLKASIEWKDITEDKLSDIVKWVTEIKQNNKSELMCEDIRNKLEKKYGYDWNCYFGKIHDWGRRYTDSYVRFKFKEIDDKRLIIYRSQGRTFIHFNQTQIRNSINQKYTFMDQDKQNKAIEWLEEALNEFTDANGKERKGSEICIFMQNNFQSEYGYKWNCIFGTDSFAAYTYDQERIWFHIYKQFDIFIFRTDEYSFNYSLDDVRIAESTLTKGKEKNTTTWLYEALLNSTKYYNHRTSIGKFDKICDSMVDQFNKTYGGDWQCLLTKTYPNRRRTYTNRRKYLNRKPDKFIEFELKDNIRIVLFDIRVLPTDQLGLPLISIVGKDGELLPTSAPNIYLTREGEKIPKDDQGRPLDSEDRVLPTDASGRYVHSEEAPFEKPIPTSQPNVFTNRSGDVISMDSEGRPFDKDGQVLPTDYIGQYVHEEPPVPTEATGKPQIVVRIDGRPLPTDDRGHYVDIFGIPIPTSADGKYIGPDSSPLPTDAEGNVVYVLEEDKTLLIDEVGLSLISIVGKDGKLLPTSAPNVYVDRAGEEIKKDEQGHPLDSDGQVLPTDSLGRYVYEEKPLVVTKPTGKPQVIVRIDGDPLPTNASGTHVDVFGSPIPISADGSYIGSNSSPLPTDAESRAVYRFSEIKAVPTDELGHPIITIVGKDGKLLPTSAQNIFVNHAGNEIPKDDQGRPLDSDGYVLPTDASGRYVYKEEEVPVATTLPIGVH